MNVLIISIFFVPILFTETREGVWRRFGCEAGASNRNRYSDDGRSSCITVDIDLPYSSHYPPPPKKKKKKQGNTYKWKAVLSDNYNEEEDCNNNDTFATNDDFVDDDNDNNNDNTWK